MSIRDKIMSFLDSEQSSTIIPTSDNNDQYLMKMEVGNFDLVYGYDVYLKRNPLEKEAELLCVYHRPTKKIYGYSYHFARAIQAENAEQEAVEFDSIKIIMINEIADRIKGIVKENPANLVQDKLVSEEALEKEYKDYSCEKQAVNAFLKGKKASDIIFNASYDAILNMIGNDEILLYIDEKPVVEFLAKKYIEDRTPKIQFTLYQDERLRKKMNEMETNPDPLMLKAIEINKAIEGKQNVTVTFKNPETSETTVSNKIPASGFCLRADDYYKVNQYKIPGPILQQIGKAIYGGQRYFDIMLKDVVKIEFSGKTIWSEETEK